MKKILKLLLAVVMSIVCVFSTVACGGDDTIVVHTNAFFPPFEYYQGTEIVGVDIEIMNKVGLEMGKKVVFEDKDFGTLIDSTAEGVLCDCSAAGLTITDERAQKVNFSVPYYTSVQYVIFAKNALEITQNTDGDDVVLWSALANKKVGVQLDTTGHIYVDLEIEGDEGYTGALEGTDTECVPFDSAQLAYDSLKAGNNIDVVVVDKLPAQYLIKNDTNDYVALPLYYTESVATSEDYAIAVNKNQNELLQAINKVLNELLADVDADGNNGIERLVMQHFAI